MKAKEFVKEFRMETMKHLEKWYTDVCPDDIPIDDFINAAAKKESKRDCYWKQKLHKISANSMIEFTIDGANYRILDKPTAIAYVYKHANKAI